MSNNITDIERIQGERRPVSCQLRAPDGVDTEGMTASYIYTDSSNHIVEQGDCTVKGNTISVMLEHERSGPHQLLITCLVSQQIIRGRWEVGVRDINIQSDSNP